MVESLPNFEKYDRFSLILSQRHTYATPTKDIIPLV